MKQLIRIGLILYIIMCTPIQAQFYGELIAQEETVPDRIDMTPISFFTDSAAYTPGGVTFSYPSGVFTSAPSVVVSPEVPTSTAGVTYIATVSNNSATSVTVTVYVLTESGGVPITMVEAAAPDNVTVNVFAAGGSLLTNFN